MRVLQSKRGGVLRGVEPYTRCIALDPTHVEAHCSLGNVLICVRRDYANAKRMYRKTIDLDPTNATAHWALSRILQRKDDFPGAVKLMEEFVRLGGFPGSDGKRRLAMLRRNL